jgi:hypothetical protein
MVAVMDERGAVPVPEAGRWIGVGTTTAWKMVYSGALRTLDLPDVRRRLVPLSEVERILCGDPLPHPDAQSAETGR